MTKKLPQSHYEARAMEAVERYFERGIEVIDRHWGKGAAADNPALLAGFMQACATEYAAGIGEWSVGENLEEIHKALSASPRRSR